MVSAESLKLRRAQMDDADFIWRLSNDPTVRAVSFSTDPIPWENHVKWLKGKLSDSSCIFFIAEIAGVPIGQVRFDIKNGEAVISVSLESSYRGKGIGSSLMALSTSRIFELADLDRIQAYVKPDNKASIYSFLKANFKDLGLITLNGHKAIQLTVERGK
jgi:UDP-2,4-diacetamido-2,4,6-trideoxy-beta-L-altropyranose hydrolase